MGTSVRARGGLCTAGPFIDGAEMTSPRPRYWQNVVSRTTSAAENVSEPLVTGPCTVARIIFSVSAWCDGPVFFGFWRYAWGISTGTAAANPVDPNADRDAWMVWQAVQIPDAGTAAAVNGPADTMTDSEGMRTLADGESLWFTTATFPNGPSWQWQWQGRVLVIDP